MKTRMALCIGLVLAAAVALPAQVTLDAGIKPYKKTSGISGNLTSIGSDTLNNLMTLWAEEYRGQYPGVRIQIEGKGSGTAPVALISGVSQLGPMSRKMKAKEADSFEKAFGYKPTAIPVAVDGLAVYVHKDNPITQLSLQQVDAIFSKTRLGGASATVNTWGQIGLAGSWSKRGVSLFGRNSASGTYGYFKKKALFKGDFKDTVKEQPGSASVVQGVAETLGGIGYSGIGYKTSEVRAVALSKDGKTYFEPVPQHVYAGKYPLARFLYVYVNKKPNTELDPMIHEFFKFVLSRQGQEIVVKDGYLPLKAPMVRKSLALLSGSPSFPK